VRESLSDLARVHSRPIRSSPCSLRRNAQKADNRHMTLLVRVGDREGEHELPVPPELTTHEELTRFLNRQGPYALEWIRLGSGEYVRYQQVVSIRTDESGKIDAAPTVQ
jgi:hypothetical protein